MNFTLSRASAAFAASVMLLAGLMLAPAPASAQAVCALPGSGGSPDASGIVNTYYQGNGNLAVGATGLTLGTRDTRGSATPVAVNDLLLIIQMQDGSINASNNANYGAGTGTGQGTTTIGNAGRHEFVRVDTVGPGAAITFSPALSYGYVQAAATATEGQRRYQVIRVPQYASTTARAVTAPAWGLGAAATGETGGVVAMDVRDTLTLGDGVGATIENLTNRAIFVGGKGFRGGAGYGDTTDSPLTDWRSSAATVRPHGGKGEGIAGTPRFVAVKNSWGFLTTNAPLPDGSNLIRLNTGAEGYPNGSRARGAPGNAGGGGTDGGSNNNQYNAGGGGGGNYAPGGIGGRPYNRPLNDTNGRGGAGYAGTLSFSRVLLGGGGGAGSSNNATTDATVHENQAMACSITSTGNGDQPGARCSSGAAGGGIVILRARSITGPGIIDARGAHGYNVANDAGGGGGGGGSVVIYSVEGGSATINASGGDGGNAWANFTGAGCSQGAIGCRHGPGGGGGGGFVAFSPASMSITATLAGGVPGRTTNGPTDTYEATGHNGGLSSFVTPDTPGVTPGALCTPDLRLAKSNGGSTLINPGTSSYSLTVSNVGSAATTAAITVVDVLPGGLSIADGPVPLSGPQAANWACTAATGTITCTSAVAIAASGTSSFAFVVNVVGVDATSVVNRARVGGGGDPGKPTPDGTTTGNCTGNNTPAGCATDVDTINAPLLGIGKSGPTTVLAGGSASYTVSISNLGAAPTVGTIRVVDVLPTGMTYVGASPFVTDDFNCTYTAGAPAFFQCERAAPVLAPGATANLVFPVAVSAAAPSALTNRARVGGGGDPSKPALPTSATAGTCPAPSAPATSYSDTASGCASVTSVVERVDLRLEKDDGQNFMAINGQTTYQFIVRNTGDADSVGTIQFRDVLQTTMNWPVALTVGGPNAAAWACVRVDALTATCSSSVLIPAGGTSQFSLLANVGAATDGTLYTNKARIAGGGDADLGSVAINTDVTNCTGDNVPLGCALDINVAQNAAQIRMAKSHAAPAAVNPGASVTFNLVVSNTGGTASAGTITVVDVLPAGFTPPAGFTSGGFNCTVAGQVLTCTRATAINPGASATISYAALVTAGATNALINRAQVGGGGDPQNGTAPTPTSAAECTGSGTPHLGCAIDTIPLNADLQMGKTQRIGTAGAFVSTPLTVENGDTIQFQLTVTNNGPAIVSNASITDTVPAQYSGLFVVSATPTGTTSGCVAANFGFTGNVLAGTITSLADDATCAVIVQGTVDGTGVAIDNTATVNVPPGINDPTPGNNSSTVTATIAAADLAMNKSDGGVSAVPGGSFAYTLDVTNNGPSVAENVSVVDTIPAGLVFVSASGTGWACNFVVDTVTCSRATLAPGAAPTITLQVSLPAGYLDLDPFFNSASVSSSTTDPVPGNNADTESTPVALTPVVGIAKLASAPTSNPDGTFSTNITLTVANLGNEALNAVSVTDALATAAGGSFGTFSAVTPAAAGEYTVTSLGAAGLAPTAGFTGAPGNTQAASGTLAIGQTATVTFTLTFFPDAAGPYSNQADADGTGATSGDDTTDSSDDGADPDTDGDGNPNEPGENDPTPIGITLTPQVGIAKAASAATSNPDGTFSTNITLTVSNLGNEALNAVSVTDALATAAGGSFGTFATPPDAAGEYTVSGLSASGLTANPAFTGETGTTQAASGNLAIGQSATVSFTLTFFPNAAGPFNNQAIANGTGAISTTSTNDSSDNGTDPDANDNGNPGDSGEDDTTPIGVTLTPQVGIAKAASAATSNPDGTFSTNITLTVANLGNEALSAVSVTDALATAAGGSFGTFAAPADTAGEYTVTGLSASGLTATPGFTGAAGNTQAASGTLAIGQSATVSFTLTFFPNATGPFNNQAVANGTGAISTTTTNDSSDNGTDPDANDNGNPGDPGEDDPTPIGITLTPQVGIAKAASAATSNPDGTFSTNITLTVSNLGNEALNAVSVTDALATAAGGSFGTFATPADAAGEYTVTGLSASGLTATPSFTGAAGNTQAASGTLAIGQSATVSFTLTFFPNATGPFNNQAIATGTGAISTTATNDNSDNGTDPDSNDNGNPNEPGENDPTPIGITLTPQVGIAKAASAATSNPDGTFSTNITLTVSNLGNEALNAVSVTDALATAAGGSFGTFATPADTAGEYTVTGLSASGLTANPAFTGETGTTQAASGTLAIGQSATVSFTLTFFPDAAGPFNNQAIANGTGAISTTTTNDSSDNGTDPDANDNGNPGDPGEDDPTPIGITLTPQVGIAKAASAATSNPDGTFSTNITLTVANLGNEALAGVTVNDALATAAGGSFGTFATPADTAGEYTVTGLSASGLTATPSFTGAAGNTQAASGTLAIGQSATVSFTLTFFPDDTGPFNNQAIANGTGAISTTATNDSSDNGTDPDANDNGNPGDPGEDDPTPIGITLTPQVGIAKAASAATSNPDGTFSTNITLTVANLGNEALNAVSVTDTLATAAGGSFGTFATPADTAGEYTVTGLSASGLTANPAFTGETGTTQAASGALAIGQSATVSFTLTFFPDATGPFNNQAIANGTGAISSTATNDSSDNGTDPDSNDNGDPNEPGENDPTPIGITLTPQVGIAKAASAATSNPDGTFSTNITLTVSNLGNEALAGVTVNDALATAAGGSFGTFATPADTAGEYTVTGLSASGLTANPAFTGAPGSIQAASGALAIGQSATVSFTLTFFPDAAGPFNNQAIANGTGAISSTATNDSSDNGTDPDSNDNGNPNEPGENDPTPISITLTPQVGIAKAASAATPSPDGTFSTSITLTVSNLGNEPLNSVAVTDALATAAGGSFGAYVAGTPATAGEYTVTALGAAGLTTNPAFTGEAGNTQVASGTLAIGQTATVSFTLTFFPDAAGPFNNQALANASGATSGTSTNDASDDGTDPDANGDGDPTGPNEDDPTPIGITLTPQVGIAKAASAAVDNGDGTFTTVVVLTAENLGNEALVGLTLADALASADGGSFGTYTAGVPGAIGTYSVTSIAAAGLAADAGFTGEGATQTLATGTLAIGQTATAAFTLRFFPDGTGPFNNQAQAEASGGTSGTSTNDASDDGTNPDADGDSNPNEPGENDPTPVSITLTPRIGIAKSVTGAMANGDGSSSTTVTLTVENLGNEALVAVDVTDALATAAGGTFGTYTPGNPGAAGQYTVTAVSAAGLTAVPTFTGAGTDLSVATGALAIGQTATATFTLRFFPDGNGPFNNQAEAEGTGVSSTQGTTDLSDNGLDPDPNGDGDANDPDEDDPTPVTPAIALPTATDDGVSTSINTPVTVPVLDNDTFGTDGPSATPVTITIAPANGTATVDDGGTPNDPSDDQILYTPNPGFTGVDTVTYRICDANGDCTTAEVTITITAGTVDAIDDADTTAQDTPVTTDVLDNDTTTGQPLDPGSVTVTVDSPDGSTTVNPDGSITFTPNPGFNGTTTYTYEVCDTTNPTPVCDTAIVTILVPIGSADLTVLKTGPANTEPGEQIVFTIDVANLGPDPAGAVVLTDPTPAGLEFVSNAGDCITAFPCALGDMAVGETRTVLATFLVPDDYAGSPTIINIATVTSDTPDPTPGDTSSSASTLVEGGAPPPVPQPLNIPVDDRWAMLLLGLAMLLLAGTRLRRMG